LAVGAPSFAGESLTWLLNSLVMPKVSTSFSIRRVETPEQVAGRHHRRQRPFGALAPLEQPVREVLLKDHAVALYVLTTRSSSTTSRTQLD